MAEEITKVIENVDELFPEIVVNGESYISERYVEPEPTPSQSLPQSSEEQTETQPQQDVQGEYVDTLSLNGVEHDLKDSPLSAEVQALQTLLSTIQSRLNELNALIPSTATAQNQLADKNFVNSSIATNTANFLGTYTSLADIEAIQNPTNNDYAFLETADGAGNNVYDRYKYSAEDGEWLFEYELNNSSFTAEQWATINSGISQVSNTVQDGDTNPVSSDAVYEALQNVTSPVDVVEDDNMNAVTSNAVYEALQNVTSPVDVVEDDNMNAVTSNAVYNFKPAEATHADTATSAGKLTTARKVWVKLGTASTSETKDFSGDTAIPVNGTLGVAQGGTGATSAANARTNLGALSTTGTAADSSKLGGYGVRLTSIGGSAIETNNYWTYVKKSKFTADSGYIVYSNGLIIQWGEYYTTSYTRNMNGKIIMPIDFSNNNYSVIITPQQQKNTSSSNNLEIATICIGKADDLHTFYYRCYGHSSEDTPYGLTWFAIGY